MEKKSVTVIGLWFFYPTPTSQLQGSSYENRKGKKRGGREYYYCNPKSTCKYTSIHCHENFDKLSCLGLSRGSFSISTETEVTSSFNSAILSSFRVLFAQTVKAIVVTIAIMKEIMLYTISTVVKWCFPYCASANVFINRPLRRKDVSLFKRIKKKTSSKLSHIYIHQKSYLVLNFSILIFIHVVLKKTRVGQGTR